MKNRKCFITGIKGTNLRKKEIFSKNINLGV